MFAAVMAKVKTPSISIKNLPRYRMYWDSISIRATEASHRLTWPKQPPTLGVDAGCEGARLTLTLTLASLKRVILTLTLLNSHRFEKNEGSIECMTCIRFL